MTIHMVKRKISPIGEIIQSVFAKFENAGRPFQEDIELVWKKLVGEDGFKYSRPVAIKKEILIVLVSNSDWLETLVMQKRGILKGLKRKLGRDRISEINFKIGEF